MKYLIALILTIQFAHAGDFYLIAGKGTRHGAAAVAVGYLPVNVGNGAFGVEVELNDCGEQPNPHQNINRMLNFNLVGRAAFNKYLYGFGKIGASSTRYSFNGTNDYAADKGLTGHTAAIGVETPISETLLLGLQASVFEYQQSSNPNMGGYSNLVLFVRWLL
jgi:hypothetical protein